MSGVLLKESVSTLNKAPQEAAAARASRTAGVSSRAFEDLFLEHWPRVFGCLLRLVGDSAEAEDLALEAFVRLYQRPPRQLEASGPGGWLHRVATNLGLQSIRSRNRRERYELAAGKRILLEAPEDRPAEIVAGEDEHRLARVVLSHMKERQAQLLVMRHSGMSYKEIAALLDLSPTSIGPLLLRAEREFEKRYRAVLEEEQ